MTTADSVKTQILNAISDFFDLDLLIYLPILKGSQTLLHITQNVVFNPKIHWKLRKVKVIIIKKNYI